MSALHIVTTSSRRTQVERLLGPDGGLARLERYWGIAIPSETAVRIYVFSGPDGESLQDIRNSAESACFAKGITDLVRRLTMDPDLALHASIAGGRKTMSFHLGNVMTLFARPHDRLSHVLVDPEFQDCPGFWFPLPNSLPPEERLIVNRLGKLIDASMANIDLTEIEYIRLRGDSRPVNWPRWPIEIC